MENMTVNITVVANGGWGVASLPIKVEYKGDPDNLHHDVVIMAAAMGYPSVLGYKGDWEMVMGCLDYKELFETLMQKVTRLEMVENLGDALNEIRNVIAPHPWDNLKENQKRVIEKWEKNGVVLTFERDKWWANKYYCKESVDFERRELITYIDATRQTLRMLGMDPDGDVKKRQMAENFGMYR